MIRLSAATVLLQWSVGGLLFLWVTTRRREVGLGYGWLLRSVYLVMAVGAFAAGRATSPDAVRDGCALLVALITAVVLAVSIVRRKAGVAGARQREDRRRARVAAMTGVDPAAPVVDRSGAATPAGRARAGSPTDRDRAGSPTDRDRAGSPTGRARAEFPPVLDLIAPAVGAVGLIAAAIADGGPHGLAIARTLAGTALLGSVTDAMLLGHWYLVQPGLGRARLNELVRWVVRVWPFEVAAFLWPTGMPAVLSGRINDGYGGILGWFWVACAVATVALCLVTKAALKERYYSAVMSATGLLYLAILTAFGTDLVARAILAS